MTNYRAIKRTAMEARGHNLGMERAAFISAGVVNPAYRAQIVHDVHRTLRMMDTSGHTIPRFLIEHDARAMNALMGVEGFLMPPRLASYNDLKDESFSGIFQFGPNTFGDHAQKIADRLNAMKRASANHDMFGQSSLPRAVLEAGHRDWASFQFTAANVWHFHDNPVVQTVAAVLHHGNRLNKIQELGNAGVISHREQMGLLTISHNIPALSNLIMDELAKGGDRPNNHPTVAKYNGMMANNPALYNGTSSLRNILARVSDYASSKAEHMRGFTPVLASAGAHAPAAHNDADREALNTLVRQAIEGERRRPGITAADSALLGRMIAEMDKQGIKDQREMGYELRRDLSRGDPHVRLHRIEEGTPTRTPAPTAPAVIPAIAPKTDPIAEFLKRADADGAGAAEPARRGGGVTTPRVN